MDTNPKRNTNIKAIILILVLSSVSMMTALDTAAAAVPLHTSADDNGSIALPDGVTPDIKVKTDVYLSLRPNPVGINQIILINLWNDPGPSYARYFTDYVLTITHPNGEEEVIKIDSYPADGTAWLEYQVDEIGTWKFKFDFLGGFFPAGNYTIPEGVSQAGYTETYTKSVYYLPDSTPETLLTVQEEQVASWTPAVCPTDYWTRPVSPENREWSSILGDYPWVGPGGGADWPEETSYYASNYQFTPYVQSVDSSHIVWKNQGAIGGLTGGSQGIASFTSGGGTPNIIYQGRCYQSVTKPFDGETQSVWQCYDLRTGAIIWERTGVTTPTSIEYGEASAGAVAGAETVSTSASLIAISGNRLIKYNPATGAVTTNVSIPSFTTTQYYMNGYALSVQTINASELNFRLINWTTQGSTSSFNSRIVSNITYALNSLGNVRDFASGTCFVIREPNALDSYGLSPYSGFPYVDIYQDGGTGIRHGMRILAVSLVTGKILWNSTVDDEPYSSDQAPYSQSCNIADHGKLAVLMRKGYFNVYDQATGNLLFKTEAMDYPWDEPGFGAYDIASAYGMIFRGAYSGVYAFDWDTGEIVWKYEAPTNPYETPYTTTNGTTVNAFYGTFKIFDGKVYIQNTEHTPTQPITRGLKLHCIDAYTGVGVWNITGCMSPGAMSDGYLTASNTYDGYTYVIGKGKSATTIEGPKVAATLGQSVILTGTILDQSPAQPETACVSKESMSEWMEYLHMQHAIPASVIGVPVSIDAVDPNGNFVHIGDTTTDGYSGTFGYTWEPEISGQYTVTATFMGDESYSSSFATTYVSIVNAPSATTSTETINLDAINNTTTTTVAAAAIAIIIAVIVVGLLIIKKK
ncbi:MAG: PQQ-binding-like beta-propeller repeat protein [Candidatus Bathyarchaeia archaeon]